MNSLGYASLEGIACYEHLNIQSVGVARIRQLLYSGIGIDPHNHELVFEKFYQTGEVLLHLPEGFEYRVLTRIGMPMSDVELRDLLAHSQPSWTAPEMGYRR